MARMPKLAGILMASGRSARFGSNKLLAPFHGRPMVETVLENVPAECFHQIVVVTRFPEVAVSSSQHGFTVVENQTDGSDPAVTIRLGMEALPPGVDGCMYLVCDQPLLRPATITRLAKAFQESPDCIVAAGHAGRRGNPVVFPSALFGELASLPSGKAGNAVISAHTGLLRIVEVKDYRELWDVDREEDLPGLEKAY